MIPETVNANSSAAYDKKKRKRLKTDFGLFVCRDVPKKACPVEQMMRNYDDQPHLDKRNVVKEIVQEMVLCGLSRTGFFITLLCQSTLR